MNLRCYLQNLLDSGQIGDTAVQITLLHPSIICYHNFVEALSMYELVEAKYATKSSAKQH